VRKERIRIEDDGAGRNMCGPADNMEDLAAPGRWPAHRPLEHTRG